MKKEKPPIPEIQIEKGIPIGVTNKKTKFPFSEMEIGDSFLIPSAWASSATHQAKRKGFKIVTRTIGENTRVWRKA